ncbi:chitinase-like protein 2-like [Trifolium pratense]|uniref:Chitinase-like protein 2-like n=1 Tax=Trifolium pratense TaxID=57577 RepID=A0A2K3N8R4_TRIPR|nr:chitinase-like protein 2-like [Trifolium pratense]
MNYIGGYGVATGGPFAWGLCYNKELSPDKFYCDEYYKLTYPCSPGAAYYGRGAIPIYCEMDNSDRFTNGPIGNPPQRNYNYGKIGEALKVDLLNHPEYIEQNATLAFQAALWKWMTPPEKHIPSPHDVFVGNWKPTKNDTLSKRVPGFGATINILYGDQVCGQGVGREEAGPNEILSCAEQAAFKPSGSPSSSTT